jgi:nicotinate-nucleotide--dimethylbenzimidazole phosphoribosyltransferase
MKTFHIIRPGEALAEKIVNKIDNLAKPKGALGRLEEIALQVCLIQQSLNPELNNPFHLLFAGDHGIVEEGVSVAPKEITWQQLLHFAQGGGGVNFLCRQHNFRLKIIDAGVDYDFPNDAGIINGKIRKGTNNCLKEPAMSVAEMELCISRGAAFVQECSDEGCNIVSFGEMGIGNTAASALWMTLLSGLPLEKCVGAGSGLDAEGVKRKYAVLKRALETTYAGEGAAADVIRCFGGFEMVMAVGAMLKAAELKMIILVDGFIMTNCMLAASRLCPEALSYSIFGHQGDEAGHKYVLDYLGVTPLLNLGLRLGEGTGALCAYPIVDSALRMINEMGSFRQANVLKYF